ncbi:superoxide dismutase [Cu-Zn]-like [Cydia amplana]|uniref:superoxide dismutase [Cu-Zn]-like n=1 Tax=Cydia amplana TaxID=1869771 RepID=UPI002FE6A83E
MKHIVLLAACVAMAAGHHGHVPELRAIARVGDPNNPANIQGNVTFTQLHDGKVRIEGTILGLPHGQYGFHVHEKGDLTGGCLSTGGHFNPEHKQHGHPNDEERHVGDLGNVEFDDTRIGRIDFTDSLISLVGEHGILGRAVVLHERADDFGRSDHPDSRKTGNAGGRVACGVIGILDPVDGWSNTASIATIAPSMFLLSSLLVLLR